MIVNHEYKFIFLKTRKTACTSVEIALSAFCGPDDVITPISEEDEKTRQEMGFRGSQNCQIATSRINPMNWRRKPLKFYNHAPARFVRRHVGRAIWNEYFKFCFERNPFDKAISRYYWSTRGNGEKPSIGDYLDNVDPKLVSNWSVYTINNKIAVDFVGRYERLAEDLQKVKERLGLQRELVLPNAKGSHRTDRRHYSQVLSPHDRARIEELCANEIAAFGYEWQDSEK